MTLTLREDYWHDTESKAKFRQFLIDIFGLDLSLWDQCGFWDDAYRPFSLFDGRDIASSLCLYSMTMTVNGQSCLAGQFSAVATQPSSRRQGLGARLTRRALEWASETHNFFFLFANEKAFPFYRACGFSPVIEYKSRLLIDGRQPIPGAVSLDMKDPAQRTLVYRYAGERTPVSRVLGVHNPKLLMFWCLYGLRNDIYHIPALDIIVLCRREGAVLTVYDIVGRQLPSFDDIYPYISRSDIQAVEFQFMPDCLSLSRLLTLVPQPENGTYLFGSFPLDDHPFIFPFTAHA